MNDIRSVRDVLGVHETHASVMGPIDISASWNTISKLIQGEARERARERAWLKRDPNVLQSLLRTTLGRLQKMDAKALAITTHGLAAIATQVRFSPGDTVWRELEKAAVPKLGEFNAQDVSNTAWAYATAGHAAPELFDAMAEAAVPKLGEFTEQALANTAWALSLIHI